MKYIQAVLIRMLNMFGLKKSKAFKLAGLTQREKFIKDLAEQAECFYCNAEGEICPYHGVVGIACSKSIPSGIDNVAIGIKAYNKFNNLVDPDPMIFDNDVHVGINKFVGVASAKATIIPGNTGMGGHVLKDTTTGTTCEPLGKGKKWKISLKS